MTCQPALTAKAVGVLLLWMCAATAPAIAAAKKGDASYSRSYREVTLSSRQGRHYRVQLSVPVAPPPKQGYPVLYVLDGNGWFGPAADVARMREYEKLSPTIVVGIAPAGKDFFDVARSYDFTSPGTTDPDFEGIKLGGADEFLAFLDGVVKPWVGAHYRVDAHRRILFGHSMGGMFALHAMFKSPGSFDVYLAASPDIPYGGEAILKEAPAFESDPRRSQPRLLVTVGSLESGPSPALMEDYRRWYADHPEARPGQTADQAVADLFPPREDAYDKAGRTRTLVQDLVKSGVAAEFVEFDGDEHMAAAISALNRGIPFALRPPQENVSKSDGKSGN
jgi:predicted alpha/beta superfamily hydrolase